LVHPDYPWIGLGLAFALLLLAVHPIDPAIFVAAAVFLEIAAYFVVYLLTPFDVTYLVSTTLDRLVLQITPAGLLLLAVALYPYRVPSAGESSPGGV
jgi:hypothetical protein